MQEQAMTETLTTCGPCPADLEIATRAERALGQHPAIPATVSVHVGAGVAWLTGVASSRGERAEAEQVVRRVSGVARVVNQIVVTGQRLDQRLDRDRSPAGRAVW
jgi:osmotically-inducible protein OsmY